MDEIVIEVNVEDGTRGRDVTCDIKPSQITLNVKGKTILKVAKSNKGRFCCRTMINRATFSAL